MTTATKIAALLGNDGTTWKTGSRSLEDLARQHFAKFEHQGVLSRMEFPDGSALVTCADYWDIEGEDYYSFASME